VSHVSVIRDATEKGQSTKSGHRRRTEFDREQAYLEVSMYCRDKEWKRDMGGRGVSPYRDGACVVQLSIVSCIDKFLIGIVPISHGKVLSKPIKHVVLLPRDRGRRDDRRD